MHADMRMVHRAGAIALFLLLAGCDLVAPDNSTSVSGSWGGVGTNLTVSHDTTYWHYECIVGSLPLAIQLSADGSFLAQGTVTGATFRGQPLRLYGAVQADSMHLYYQVQDGHGSWAAPGVSLLVRGQAATDPGILCID
jgi:hypothetical protein